MNTELSPEITRTCSNTHGKIANNNNSDFAENNIRLQCFRAMKQHVTGTYHGKQRHGMNLLIAENKSLTDHEPKRIRRYDSTHVNMASYMTDSNMAGTTISRHVGALVPLTTEQYMA